MKNCLFRSIIILILLFCGVKAQNFKSSPLITLNGNNYDFEVLSTSDGNYYEGIPTYLIWINEFEGRYSVYLNNIQDSTSKNIIIDRDSTVKSNPQIAFKRYALGIRLAWQKQTDTGWQILYRDFHNDSLGPINIIADSLNNDPQISMNMHRISWVQNGSIYVKEFYPDLGETECVDSILCSSPILIKNDDFDCSVLMYEKGISTAKQIYMADLNKYYSTKWEITQLSKHGNNMNPNFGLLGEVSFQNYNGTNWRIVYSYSSYESMDTTTNTSCDYKNSTVYSYAVPTKTKENYTPYFIVFDTDSLDNREIFIKIIEYGKKDSLINISNSIYDDYGAKLTYFYKNDSTYISIIWIKNSNNKKDLWISKSLYKPKWTSLKNEINNPLTFKLEQNYPNPFNPSTTIKYFIPESGNVNLTIYDINGRKIRILEHGYKTRGYHKVNFDGYGLSSGIYYYRLVVGKNILTRSMLLVR